MGVRGVISSLASPKRDQISVTIADRLVWSTFELRSVTKCAMLDRMSFIPVASSTDASVSGEIWKCLQT